MPPQPFVNPPENDTTCVSLSRKLNFKLPDLLWKELIIKFNKDSVITGAEIHEWHKNGSMINTIIFSIPGAAHRPKPTTPKLFNDEEEMKDTSNTICT